MIIKCPHCQRVGSTRDLVKHIVSDHFDIYDTDELINLDRLLEGWKTIGILDTQEDSR